MNPFTAYLCLGSSMALVGSYVALSKPLVAAFPVMLLALLRFAIAAVYMAPWLKTDPHERAISPKTHRLLLTEAFLGNFLFSICMLYGVSLAGASAAAIAFAAIPACVAVLSRIFLGEAISNNGLIAIALVVISVVLLATNQASTGPTVTPSTTTSPENVSQSDLDASTSYLLGLLLLMGAVFCEASYVVIGKKLTATVSPKKISAIVNLWGLVLMAPMGLWFAWDFKFSAVAAPQWLLLVFYALAASAWSVQLWMTGLKTISASAAGVMTVMLPITATLVGVVFLGEQLSGLQVLALVLALLGLGIGTIGTIGTTGNIGNIGPKPINPM